MSTNKKLTIRNSTAEFLIFTRQNKEQSIEVIVEDDSVWLSQKLMAVLFGTTRENITLHLTDILKKELNKDSVCKKFLHTAEDGKNYQTNYYNLDAIIAVGFKINSERAIEFRLWAINILKQFAIKGYVLDKERLENGSFLNENYFDELLKKIIPYMKAAKKVRKFQKMKILIFLFPTYQQKELLKRILFPTFIIYIEKIWDLFFSKIQV